MIMLKEGKIQSATINHFLKRTSSMMLFHNVMCTKLTPEYVNTATV